MAITDEARWSRFEVVHCGIDPARFAPVDRSGRDGVEVLCVGQLLPRKGQRVLLDAVASLRDRGVDVRVTLVGDGPSRSALEAAVDALDLRDRVKLTGAVGQDDIRTLYDAADLFCLPSFAEGVPVVLMEAMAAGLPVVTTPIAGVPELVDAATGVLVAPGRADLLADALESLAADPERRVAMGRAGRAKVEAEFASSPNASRLRDLLAAL
jgi:glycosyltransferase involved in cell wall biosynthesis